MEDIEAQRDLRGIELSNKCNLLYVSVLVSKNH